MPSERTSSLPPRRGGGLSNRSLPARTMSTWSSLISFAPRSIRRKARSDLPEPEAPRISTPAPAIATAVACTVSCLLSSDVAVIPAPLAGEFRNRRLLARLAGPECGSCPDGLRRSSWRSPAPDRCAFQRLLRRAGQNGSAEILGPSVPDRHPGPGRQHG